MSKRDAREHPPEAVVELIVRGVLIRDGMLLLCQSHGALNTFLPGGHIEFGESATDALRREILEETGMQSQVGAYLGSVEHTFLHGSSRCCEINVVFRLDIPGLSVSAPPPALEPHIHMFWAAIDELPAHSLEPSVLCRLIPRWQAGPDSAERWASTYP